MKRFHLLTLCFAVLFAACSKEPSLQKYFVEKTENKNFVALDLGPSILNVNAQNLTAEQKASLDAFDKVNILAFKLDETNKDQFETEREKVTKILKDDKYQQLVKFGKGKEGGSISFVGDDDSIDEFVIYANQNESGFAVVRILGNNMNPTDVMNMVSVLKHSNVDMDQLKSLQDLMPVK